MTRPRRRSRSWVQSVEGVEARNDNQPDTAHEPLGRLVVMTAPPLYEGIIGLAVALTPSVIGLYVVYRRGWSRLDTAATLVLWGLVIVIFEHATFGLGQFGGSDLRDHSALHFQMLAAYGLAALVLVAVVVAPLIRRGEPAGWLGLLAVFLVGVGAEIGTAVVTTPHGVPPRFWSWGLALWGYPVSWAVALGLSFRPVFRRDSAPPVLGSNP